MTTRSGGCTTGEAAARTWFVKEQDITKEGWPVAQPRLSRRPSARMMTPWPSGNTKRSHCGLMFWRLMPGQLMTPAMSISLSKCPMLPTMALFFILDMCVAMMMSLLPVVVIKMSTMSSTSSRGATWKPSIVACTRPSCSQSQPKEKTSMPLL